MLGYITPDKPELKMKEYDMYSAYYCGICKAIKKRHGEIPRLVLSYDSVLLAMILSAALFSLNKEAAGEPIVRLDRCLVHPLKKKPMLYNDPAIDYAADMLVILAYYKFKDDWKDEKKAIGAIGMLAFNSLHRKIAGMYPVTCDIIMKSIEKLSQLEEENCQSIDEAAEPFAQLMKAVFSGASFIDSAENAEELKSRLEEIGYSIGKWVYLIDAVDDLEMDLKKNRYNPLKSMKDDENFSNRIEFALICALEQASLALQKLELEKNKGIIENIIYFGLFKKTESILGTDASKNIE